MKKNFVPIPPEAPLPEGEEIDVAYIYNRYMAGDIDIICVLGPTASGKTRYAVGLAREINSLAGKSVVEIISADSRQVYRGMDIGKGKDLSEYEEIPWHLMDIVPAGAKYNIYEYQRDFEAAYRDIRERGGVPILCGGSGLYIEAATCGYSLPDVPENPEFRAWAEGQTTEALIERLASLKPLHNSTDYDTRKRLIRALEIAEYEAVHPVNRTAYLPKSVYYIGTLVSREERNHRIDARLDARLREGMVEEVRGLLEGEPCGEGEAEACAGGESGESCGEGKAAGGASGESCAKIQTPRAPIPAEDLIYYGLEYKFVTLYIKGDLSFEQMRSRLATAIHQFAKRQMTWFRGMERRGVTIHWTKMAK